MIIGRDKDGEQVTRGKPSLKMEDGTFIIIQLFVVLSVIAGNKAKLNAWTMMPLLIMMIFHPENFSPKVIISPKI